MSEPVTKKEFHTAMEKIDSRFEKLEKEMNHRFEKLETKMDRRFEKVDESIRHQGVLFEDLSHKMDLLLEVAYPALEKIPKIEARLDGHDQDIALIKTALKLKH